MNAFETALADEAGLCSEKIDAFQINIGLTCNLECRHCHVSSNPRRKEQMSWETMEHVFKAIADAKARVVDITGGAPEMNPHFTEFIERLIQMGITVQVRTNLTILLEDGYTQLPEFYAQHKVHLVASLPCYLEDNVDKQRGEGVYQESVDVIKQLNALGYGRDESLPLGLVYNPGGPSLPPEQGPLEEAYRKELKERFDIDFTYLSTITNMAIGQFRADLKREGKFDAYDALLKKSFNGDTVEHVMCRHQINVGHDGSLYDCDFNLALKMPVGFSLPKNIRDFRADDFRKRRIVTGNHCFGCTAGAGSSCSGALV